ncbi:MAG TPA: hypothetical protein DCY62_09465 [Thalassospira sp.]|nr:hypothetical protein [Thalassospira sp.]
MQNPIRSVFRPLVGKNCRVGWRSVSRHPGGPVRVFSVVGINRQNATGIFKYHRHQGVGSIRSQTGFTEWGIGCDRCGLLCHVDGRNGKIAMGRV